MSPEYIAWLAACQVRKAELATLRAEVKSRIRVRNDARQKFDALWEEYIADGKRQLKAALLVPGPVRPDKVAKL